MGMPGEQREPDGFELADVGRVARHSVGRWVKAARIAEQPTFSDIIAGHLHTDARGLPVAEERWPSYEHVNVQAGLDAWLATGEWEHDTLGMTGYRHRGPFGLSDLLSADEMFGPAIRPGNISTVRLAAGPDGDTVECLRAAVILLSRAGDRAALLVRGSDRESDMHGVTVEIIASRDGLAAEIGARVRAAAVEHNVFRGHVVSFGQDMFGERGSALKFRRRPSMSREQLILPEETFSDVRRQVVGVARNRDRLRAAGQHLKRGLLLYGPPGVGKTHTIRYLISELADTTVVELTGETLHAIREACSVARTLQPAVIVVEDVDLIAEQRDHYSGQTPSSSRCSTRWTGSTRTPTSSSC
ncbi:hypothetical protein DDE18_07025 [Nocardioides gansuensis]|uniref:ATPase AAA-type core domain-containing protein n=1 Tax=Nocardioides gansuensis TaxID=2138300 RepID=A0A2T8FBJ4_9ACTN|nr:ATP-binding protein [Nocardioides gansuensis]PVG83077.1 hypothetical protein DDE18_07025 [Nocardioides gansuensis]